ncbi:TIGR01458 family HAD-type hydrolase [Nocardioides guangzhouensis]|uniref:Haloacid dehalogenase-like hydrolase domain-containing protein 2 n=2 Tax=Nocardioides guangzhouensis TaxID=2497878 RepID=A0A4Q4Z1L2_9ACTN|nr:TIGR01458 family HAD-type hydrolase [Nocardioides guangzhouensis]
MCVRPGCIMEGVKGLLLDLDGVVHVGDAPVPGAADAVAWLRREGVPHLFLTNTTSRPRSAIVDRLRRMGVDADTDRVLTPAVAALDWLRAHGRRRPALFVPEATGAELADLDPLPPGATEGAEAVVVGDLGTGWDFPTLNRAFRLLAADPDVPLVALGLTRYWRAEDGLRLDAGPYVRALEYAVGREAVVLGKPDQAFYAAATAALGLAPYDVAMVGDDVRTDVGGAQQAGLAGVLVRTGKFRETDLAGDVVPDAVLDSLADLPAWWSGGPVRRSGP